MPRSGHGRAARTRCLAFHGPMPGTTAGGKCMPAHRVRGAHEGHRVRGTGAIGRELVEDLVFRGYQVIVVISQWLPAPAPLSDGVTVLAEDPTDPAAAETVVAGRRAVITTLDPRLRPYDHRQPLVETTQQVVAAMGRCGTGRYIGCSTLGGQSLPREHPTAHCRAHRLMAQVFPHKPCQQMQAMA